MERGNDTRIAKNDHNYRIHIFNHWDNVIVNADLSDFWSSFCAIDLVRLIQKTLLISNTPSNFYNCIIFSVVRIWIKMIGMEVTQ